MEIVMVPGDRFAERSWQKSADFMLLGLFFGIVTGVAEVAARFAALVIAARSYHDLGLNMIWMIPLADVVLFGVLGLLIGLTAMLSGSQRPFRVGLVVLVATAAYTALHYIPIHDVARLLLALGVGIQGGRILIRHADWLRRVAGAVTWPALIVVMLTAFGFRATDIVKERRALERLGPAMPGAPNVLLIILDAVRAPDLGLYGYARSTSPNLDRFARTSVVFDRAIPTAPWSLPSHASIFTGRYPHEMSADWDVPLDATFPTLAEMLRDRGYVTGGFVANHFYGMPEFGLSRGFIHYESRAWSFGPVIASSRLGAYLIGRFNKLTHHYYRPGRRSASEINRRLLNWLPKHGSRPFFVFVNFFDAHEPYAPPPPYDHRFNRTEPGTRESMEQRLSPAELRGMRDAYDGAIAYLDEQFGELFRELQKRGELTNTLVIITSDHGEEFGEHGWVSHGNGLYYPGLHVPLVVSFAGRIPAGIRVSEPVTLRDIPATTVGLVGIDRTSSVPGRSLAVNWQSPGDSSGLPASPLLAELKRPRNSPAWYAVAKGDMESIIVGRHHYIRNGDGREELFDIGADPWEMNNLVAAKDSRPILENARTALVSALAAGARPVGGARSR